MTCYGVKHSKLEQHIPRRRGLTGRVFILKGTFDVPYEDISEYPTPAKAMEAISRYYEASGNTCIFTGGDEFVKDNK